MAARSTLTVTSGTTITSAWGNAIRDHAPTYTTSNDVATEGQLAVNTSTDKLVVYSGAAAVELSRYGTDDTFTVSYTQSFSVSATNYTHVRRRGVWAEGNLRSDFTSNGSSGFSIQIATSLPAPTRDIAIGAFMYFDNGTTFYTGTAILTTGSAIQLYGYNQGGIMGAAPAFSIVSSDVLYLSFGYPAAAV